MASSPMQLNMLFHEDVTDLNDAIYTGFYTYRSDMLHSASAQGLISGNGNMLVIKGSMFTHQIVFIGNTYIVMRRSDGVSWNAWTKVDLK